MIDNRDDSVEDAEMPYEAEGGRGCMQYHIAEKSVQRLLEEKVGPFESFTISPSAFAMRICSYIHRH